jgi:protein subunit release factor A
MKEKKLLEMVALRYSVNITERILASGTRKYINRKYPELRHLRKELRKLRNDLLTEDDPKEIRRIQKEIIRVQKEIQKVRNIQESDRTLQELRKTRRKAKELVGKLDDTIINELIRAGYRIRPINVKELDSIGARFISSGPREVKSEKPKIVELKNGASAPAKPGRGF